MINTNIMQKTMKKGFTLIELLIVIAIIGLLATIAIVSLSTAQQKARDAKRVADIKQLQSAVELHFSEERYYPSFNTWADLSAALTDYITQIPVDPTNNDGYYYVYAANAADGAVDALGADHYVLGARIEDGSKAASALNGDNGTDITAATTDWGSITITVSTPDGEDGSGDFDATGLATGSQAKTAGTVSCTDDGVDDDFYCLTN